MVCIPCSIFLFRINYRITFISKPSNINNTMDGVILATGFIASIYGIIGLLFGSEGAKGITLPYKTESGIERTAKAERSEYIV